MEAVKKDFYKLFKIGIELEGEYVTKLDNNPPRLNQTNGQRDVPNSVCRERNCPRQYADGGCGASSSLYRECRADYNANINSKNVIFELKKWQVGTDSSVNQRKSGHCYELRSNVIKTAKDEAEYIAELESFANPKGFFAYRNLTAGTHVHISMNHKDWNDYALFIFDTADFERFFMQRYIASFKSEKFLKRLGNDYCRLGKSISHGDIESKKVRARDYRISMLSKINKQQNSGRYYWLNTVCLAERQGIELRIFPHVTTSQGLNQVINFTKKTLLDYWNMKKTQESLADLTAFHKAAQLKRIRTASLTELDNLVLTSLGVVHLRDFWNLEPIGCYPRGDVQMILAGFNKTKKKFLVESSRDAEFVRNLEANGYLTEYQNSMPEAYRQLLSRAQEIESQERQEAETAHREAERRQRFERQRREAQNMTPNNNPFDSFGNGTITTNGIMSADISF